MEKPDAINTAMSVFEQRLDQLAAELQVES
jgi:hypothetical protein